MKQTVNPVHLLYNNNRLHKHIVWAPCGPITHWKQFSWYTTGVFSPRPSNTRKKRPLLAGNITWALRLLNKHIVIEYWSDNINHKGLHRTANEYAEEHRIYKDLISKNNNVDILNSARRILQCWSYYVKINSARHQHDIERTQNRAGQCSHR